MITIINTRHSNANEYSSIGGVGGYSYRDETTVVTWSDGTQLIVEGFEAKAIYKGTTYRLDRFSTLHDTVVEHWTAAISKRLKKDEPTLVERVRGGIRKEEIAERVQAWNAQLAMQTA